MTNEIRVKLNYRWGGDIDLLQCVTLKNLRDLIRLQTFQPAILIYRSGNFVYLNVVFINFSFNGYHLKSE